LRCDKTTKTERLTDQSICRATVLGLIAGKQESRASRKPPRKPKKTQVFAPLPLIIQQKEINENKNKTKQNKNKKKPG
jgi:hypothetical protein